MLFRSEIFSETDRTKTRSLIIVVATQKTEWESKTRSRAALGRAWHGVGPLATALRRLSAYLILDTGIP